MSEHEFAGGTCEYIKTFYTWKPEEKRALKNLARWSLENWPNLYRCFVNHTNAVAEVWKSSGFDWNLLLAFEQQLARDAEADPLKAAVRMAEQVIASIQHSLGGSADPSYAQLITELSDYRKRLSASGSA